MANTPKTWLIRDKHGAVQTVTNLKEFCKTNSLDYTSMWAMLNSDSSDCARSYQGYSKGGVSPTTHIATDEIALFHIDGRRTEFTTNRTHLSKTSGMSLSSLHRLIRGQAKYVLGWELKYMIIDVAGEEDL